jgi:hypothetical protein
MTPSTISRKKIADQIAHRSISRILGVAFVTTLAISGTAKAQQHSPFDGIYYGEAMTKSGKCADAGTKPTRPFQISGGIASYTIKSPLGTMDTMTAPVGADGNFTMRSQSAIPYPGNVSGGRVTLGHQGGGCYTTETWIKTGG